MPIDVATSIEEIAETTDPLVALIAACALLGALFLILRSQTESLRLVLSKANILGKIVMYVVLAFGSIIGAIIGFNSWVPFAIAAVATLIALRTVGYMIAEQSEQAGILV